MELNKFGNQQSSSVSGLDSNSTNSSNNSSFELLSKKNKKFQMSFEQKNKIIHGLDLKQLGRRRGGGGGAGNGNNGAKNKSMVPASLRIHSLPIR